MKVLAFECDQIIMRSLLDDLTTIDDGNHVCIPNGREPVRDNNRRPSLISYNDFKCFLNHLFRL
jgi:hypothetical protein